MKILFTRFNLFLVILYVLIVLPLWGGLLRESDSPRSVWNAIGRSVQSERQKIREQSKIKILNLLMPPGFSDLAGMTVSRRDPGSVDWGKYSGYFRQAALVLPAPWSADAYAMTGFCYFHQGKAKEAYESYLKSLEQNPAFIWTYNNLAYLRFKEGDYEKAVFFLDQALKVDPEVSLKVVSSSKIYTDILRDTNGAINWPAELKGAYSDAARMMVLSLYRMGKFPQTVAAAQYAVSSGLEPAVFFQYYAGLALDASGEHLKAQEFMNAVGAAAGQTDLMTAADISVRIF